MKRKTFVINILLLFYTISSVAKIFNLINSNDNLLSTIISCLVIIIFNLFWWSLYYYCKYKNKLLNNLTKCSLISGIILLIINYILLVYTVDHILIFDLLMSFINSSVTYIIIFMLFAYDDLD